MEGMEDWRTRGPEDWELNPPFISPLLERGDRGDFPFSKGGI